MKQVLLYIAIFDTFFKISIDLYLSQFRPPLFGRRLSFYIVDRYDPKCSLHYIIGLDNFLFKVYI